MVKRLGDKQSLALEQQIVEFDAAHSMVGIASGDGHTVPLCQPVSTDRQAEEWLMGLTQAMQSTVGQLVHKAVLNATAMLHDDGRGDARVDEYLAALPPVVLPDPTGESIARPM